ncbi:baseplate J/gp47 family protein [Bacillus sp. AFS017336]|uniref:baseplate J/gp47 family protein n=1 Tax=Bacillus sp. AFS017336 TaxID=2033489 RepID=UPI000BEF6316|nr:baseplate J/gp47 family protein [Bacillus sp. AFS017336]PEL12660.1 baseplate j family protein [Bacillus sp. AFS017336]
MQLKEDIMARMFAAISNDYDKSEGSIIYDAVVAVANAIEDNSIETDNFLDQVFLDTATGDYLDKRAGEFGIYRKTGTLATTNLMISGTNGTVIPAGTRFYANDTYFASTSDVTISSGTASVSVTCEVAGTIGNVPANTIVNAVNSISGVTSITNTSAVTNGTDDESDDSLRARCFAQIQLPSASGNIADYTKWCTEVTGVGAVTVIPIWNGNGTVKCVLVNSNMRAADGTLISAVQANVEAKRPIGATVTYVSATELAINVSVDVDLANGYTLAQVQTNLISSLTDYLKSVALKTSSISYAIIGSKILATPGVIDYRSLTLNSGTANVSVSNTQVAVVGTVNAT